MNYSQARFKKKKPPPNPIVTGCFGTIYLAILYGLGYGLLQVLMPRFEQVKPEFLRTALKIPETLIIDIRGLVVPVPMPNEVIMFLELTLFVMIMLGLTSTLYSFYYASTREKEGWELYEEEAERQAKMAKGRR